MDQLGGGDWFAYSGTTTPNSGNPFPAPPEGTFAAVTDQGGPGSNILYQDVFLEAGMQHTLSLLTYYRNRAGEFHSPPTLDHTGGDNQQFRIDVMKPSAEIRSVDPADILLNLFATQPGDATALDPFAVSGDLSPFAGQTVRLRAAEVDNQFIFNAAIDAVAIRSTTPAGPTARCAGRNATIVGTDGNDVLVGTSGKDVISGLKGKDTIRGRGGNDRLCGKDGKDLLKGGGGNDKLRGGDGNDTMKGGGGNDKCKGGPAATPRTAARARGATPTRTASKRTLVNSALR